MKKKLARAAAIVGMMTMVALSAVGCGKKVECDFCVSATLLCTEKNTGFLRKTMLYSYNDYAYGVRCPAE